MKEFTRADKKLFMMGFEKIGGDKDIICNYKKYDRLTNITTYLCFHYFPGGVGINYCSDRFNSSKTRLELNFNKKEWKAIRCKIKEMAH